MRKFLVSILILSLSMVACDAFKNNYDGQSVAPMPTPEDNGPIIPLDNQGLPDYESDKTVCGGVDGVEVEKSKDTGAVQKTEISSTETDFEVGDASAVVKKIATFTVDVTVTSGDRELSFVLKQTADKDFSVCSVTYGDMTVSSGKVTIEKFNDGKDVVSVINSGTFDFTFASGKVIPKTALKAVHLLVGGSSKETAKETIDVDGAYYVKGLAIGK